MQDGERDEAGEPEEHGQRVETEHGHGVSEGGEESGRQGEVDEDQEGPDGDEDHEAVLGGADVGRCDCEGGGRLARLSLSLSLRRRGSRGEDYHDR